MADAAAPQPADDPLRFQALDWAGALRISAHVHRNDEFVSVTPLYLASIATFIDRMAAGLPTDADEPTRCGNCGGELNLRCDACGTKHG